MATCRKSEHNKSISKATVTTSIHPVSILHKSIAGRNRPVRVADGPIRGRCRFIKNTDSAQAVYIVQGPENTVFGIAYDFRFCTVTICHLSINNCVRTVVKLVFYIYFDSYVTCRILLPSCILNTWNVP